MYNNLSGNYPKSPYYDQDDRIFLGAGFAGPFLLGGLTGALISPYFNRPYYYPSPYPYPYPYPTYTPYYGYRRYY